MACGESCGPLSHRAGRRLPKGTFRLRVWKEEEERPVPVRGSGTCRPDENRGEEPARLADPVSGAGHLDRSWCGLTPWRFLADTPVAENLTTLKKAQTNRALNERE